MNLGVAPFSRAPPILETIFSGALPRRRYGTRTLLRAGKVQSRPWMSTKTDPVPKGHSRIAQGFNLGFDTQNKMSPEGTAEENQPGSVVPSGLTAPQTHHPTLKRWAILKHPSWMQNKALTPFDRTDTRATRSAIGPH